MLVVCDDFALPFGKLRFREGGSAGGHNGLRSIIGELGNEQFSRLRVGIGEPGGDAIDHVLSQFGRGEKARLSELLDAAADAVEAWARDGTSKAANHFNAFELRPDDDGPVGTPGRRRRSARSRWDKAHANGLAQAEVARGRRVSVRGGRPLRRQIEAALSGEADPLGADGLGLPDRASPAGPDDEFAVADDGASAPMRRGKRGHERHVDEEIRVAYQAAQAARDVANRAAAAAGSGSGATARKLPDLRVLPPLLHASGAFATLRERLGAENAPLPGGGRHASLASVPHGAKSFLAAALAVGDSAGHGRVPAPGRPRRRQPAVPWRRSSGSGSAGWLATRRSAIAWPRSCRRGWAIPTR